MAQPALSLLDAYQTVAFGDVSPDAFLDAVQAGRDESLLAVCSSPDERLKAAWAAPGGLFLWEGGIPKKAGHFLVVNPYATRHLGSAPEPYFLQRGAGLCAQAIGQISAISTEVDEALDGGRLPIEEQCRLYDALEAATGLRFSAACLSGDAREPAYAQLVDGEKLQVGKSLHVFLALRWEGTSPETLAVRQEAADLLCAIVGGDPACRDTARKMRLGGVVARHQGAVRVQTALRAEEVAHDLRDVRDRLAAYAAELGVDVPRRLDALQTAASARTIARSWETKSAEGSCSSQEAVDAAETLRELALEIRQAGTVSSSHRRLLALVGAPKGKRAVVLDSGETRVITGGLSDDAWDADSAILTHTSGQSGTAEGLWESMRRGYRVPDIHCIQHADANASAFLTRSPHSGRFTVHCPTCGSIRSRAPGPQIALSTIDDVAEGLVEVAPVPAPQAAPHLSLVPAPAQAAPAPSLRAPQRRVVAAPAKRGPGRPKAADVAREKHQRLVEVDEALLQAKRAQARHLFAPHLDDVDDLDSPLSPAQIALAQAPPPPPPDVVTFDSAGDISLALHCGREALKRLDGHAQQVGYCKRGPILHTARCDRDTICSKRIACWSASCPACGPKMQRGLQAALAGWTSEHLEGFRGQVVVLPKRSAGSLRKAMSLWGTAGAAAGSPYPSLRGEATTAHVVLGIEASPGIETFVLAWPTSSLKDAPTGALARHLASYGAVDLQVSPAEALQTLADTIDLDAHRRAQSGRVCLLLGGAIPRGQVAELRDALVGRARGASKEDQRRFQEDKKVGKVAVIRTYQNLSETIEALGGVRDADATYEDGQIVVVAASSTTAGATSQRVDWKITGFSALQSQAQWQRARAAVPPGEAIRALELDHGPTPVDFLQSLRQAKPGAAPEIHRKTPIIVDLDAVKDGPSFSFADTPIARQKAKKTA